MAFSINNSGDDGDGFSRPNPVLNAAQAWEKIKPYCAFQERCHREVKDKLYSYGLHRPDVEVLVSRLIEANYLNEERFALQYAGGHFRQKKWGKIKITHALRQKGITGYCINKAIKAIDEEDYMATLEKLANSKWALLKKQSPVLRKVKCRDYLLQKGFESGLIGDIIKQIEKNGN